MMKYRGGGVFLRFCGLFVWNCIVYGDKIEKKMKKNCEKKKKKNKTEKKKTKQLNYFIAVTLQRDNTRV